MKFADLEFAAIDFESAGSGPGLTDEPVQIAIVAMRGGEITTSLVSYLAPSRPVTWAARAVHGIADNDLCHAPTLNTLWPQIREALTNRWVVAHGAATEKRFLRVFPLHGFGPWIDTLSLTRLVYPGLASHALGDAVAALDLLSAPEISTPRFRWHDAECDAIASLVLLRHIVAVTGLSDGDPALLLSRTR